MQDAAARLDLAAELGDDGGDRCRQVAGVGDDRELVRGLDVERHAEVDRRRQREAAHEVGVLADQVDAPGREEATPSGVVVFLLLRPPPRLERDHAAGRSADPRPSPP